MGCAKITYATKGEADKAARIFKSTARPKQKRKKKSEFLTPYRCACCGFWHLTSQHPKKENRKGMNRRVFTERDPLEAHYED